MISNKNVGDFRRWFFCNHVRHKVALIPTCLRRLITPDKTHMNGRTVENKYYKSHELSSLRARNRRDGRRWKTQFHLAINLTSVRIAEQTSFPPLAASSRTPLYFFPQRRTQQNCKEKIVKKPKNRAFPVISLTRSLPFSLFPITMFRNKPASNTSSLPNSPGASATIDYPA